MPTVLTTEALKSSQNKTPSTCGVEIMGMSNRVATGFVISLLSRPKTEFQENAWQAGGNVGGLVGRSDFPTSIVAILLSQCPLPARRRQEV